MKNINNYILSKITKIIFLICVIFQSTMNAQTLQIDNVSVNGVAISNNTIDFGNLTQVTLKFRVSFNKPLNLYIGNISYVAGTYKCNTFTQLFTPIPGVQGTDVTGFNDWREYTIYANDYPLNCGNGNKLQAIVKKTTDNVTYTSNEILITKNPRFTLTSSEELVSCNSNVTFYVNNLDNISASYQWIYDQSKWQYISGSSNSIVLKPISSPLPDVQVNINANGTNYTLFKNVSFKLFNPNVFINNQSICVNSTRTYTLSGLQQGETLIEWSINNSNFVTILNINGIYITLNYIAEGTFNLNAKIRNQCNQEIIKSFQLRSGKPAGFSPSATINGPSTVLTGTLTQYSINEALPLGATSYEWWLPHPFDNVTTFDYFGQRWQKYSGSNGNGIQAFTGYAKINGLVQVMAKNECGCSGAIMKSVSHQSSSTGGSTGGGIVKPGGGAIPRLANSNELLKYTNINIFPNPITEVLNVELLNEFDNLSKVEDVNIEIIDLQGKKVRNITDKSNKFSINVNDLSKGVYLLKINIKDKTDTQKIVIQ